ncbi:hypothetical protein [Hippea jasoniae]|uniref:hypothetical protein n=1 Tax=Hippea jasoniae TaxID=944479 RepID=UPI00054D882F|nr:hypothetical protein [Hippea jasoniae]
MFKKMSTSIKTKNIIVKNTNSKKILNTKSKEIDNKKKIKNLKTTTKHPGFNIQTHSKPITIFKNKEII